MRRSDVRDGLRRLIDGRPPGEALPSERALSVRFGASRPTVRAAIEDLARAGLLVRRHGQGTFTSVGVGIGLPYYGNEPCERPT